MLETNVIYPNFNYTNNSEVTKIYRKVTKNVIKVT